MGNKHEDSKSKSDSNEFDKIDPEKRLLSITETARILGLAEKTIYNQISRKSKNPFPIKPKRLGGLVKFSRQDIEKFIAS